MSNDSGDPKDEAELHKLSELYKQLAKYYDNPDSFFDPDLPFVHQFRIIQQGALDRPTVIRIEVEGRNLLLSMREALFNMLKTYGGDALLRDYNTDSWDIARAEILNDPEYLQLEREMYLLFARNIPPFFLTLYNALLGASLFTVTKRAVSDTLQQSEKSEIDEAAKKVTVATLRDFERDLKRILDLRSKKRGRRLGSKKSEQQRAKEAREFEKQIIAVVRQSLEGDGTIPTKTAVAKALGLGGLSARTGVDSSLNVFINKLKRCGLDYDAIIEKVRTDVNKINP
jgi:hypothetical protein